MIRGTSAFGAVSVYTQKGLEIKLYPTIPSPRKDWYFEIVKQIVVF